MHLNGSIFRGFVAFIVVVLSATVFLRVTQSTSNQSSEDDLSERVSDLESRVAQLENILFATSKLQESQAVRRVEQARQKLTEQKKLYAKGFITQLQVTNAELELQQAKRELELAKLESNTRCKVAQIEVVEAKRDFEFAKENLQHQQLLASRGFASRQEVKFAEDRLSEAEKQLVIANTKLVAAEKLKGESKDETDSTDK